MNTCDARREADPTNKWKAQVRSRTLELQVLVGREVEAGDPVGHNVLDARTEASREAVAVDRRVDDLIVHDALKLVQERLALLLVQLLRLPAEEIVNLGQRAVGESAVRCDEGLEPCGGVAADPADIQHNAAEFPLAPRRHERGAVHDAHPRADADGLQPSGYRLAHRVVGRERREVSRIESVGMTGLGQELAGARGIVRMRVDWQRELEVSRHDAAGWG